MSRLILMVLFKILGVDQLAALRFSPEALLQTVLVFVGVYILIMIMNYTFIRAQSILSLFKVTATSQTRIQRMSLWEVVIGLLGIGSICGGYYISGKLFNGTFYGMNALMFAMIAILALVIIGTYLFTKALSASCSILSAAAKRVPVHPGGIVAIVDYVQDEIECAAVDRHYHRVCIGHRPALTELYFLLFSGVLRAGELAA